LFAQAGLGFLVFVEIFIHTPAFEQIKPSVQRFLEGN
tara:strand:- start:2114 stop:2224 length:111 start_codon:yes stop_codon:yes gene_type:complete